MAGSVSADFSDGLEAYDAGRYGDALAEWRALAAEGHLDAMVAIAGLYEAGTGVDRDYRQAAQWYRRAAECGHPVAQLNLGDLFRRGQGVERDLVSAHAYLGMAAAQGNVLGMAAAQGNVWAKQRQAELWATMSTAQKKASDAQLSRVVPRCDSGKADATSDRP